MCILVFLEVLLPVLPRPDGEERRNLPVMFYLFGGGFNQGFSYKSFSPLSPVS